MPKIKKLKYTKEQLSKIPPSYYCESFDNRLTCPYWSIKKDLPEQENGYCSLLGKSDWDINEERGKLEWKNKQGKIVKITKPHEICVSLLWDKCKECDLNMPTEAYIKKHFFKLDIK